MTSLRVPHQLGAPSGQQASLRRSILDSLPFSAVVTDPAGTIMTVNPATEQLLGFTADELVGRSLAELRADAVPVTAPRTGEREAVLRRKDGSLVPVDESTSVLLAVDGTPDGLLTVAHDITRYKRAEEFSRHLAHHDALTNLPNRTRLLNHLVHAIDRAEQTGTEVVVLLLDLDHFKDINDSLGHHVGDELVVRMSARLRQCIREGDLVARLGGDEFVIVFAGVEKDADLDARIEELVGSVSTPIAVGGTELVVTASMGGVSYPTDGDPATLLKRADTAMYHSKAAGRNVFTWFDDSMLDEARDKVALTAALHRALVAEELEVAYQPLVALADREIVGMEALARWHSREHGTVGPERFIPIAEESGMIVELGAWVLRRACADAVLLQRTLGRPLKLAVNVSPRQLRSPGWPESLAAVLAESGLDPACLELEITEGIMMDDPRHALEVLEGVRRTGVAIVVDDFGTGYSSLAYLSQLPIDKIKIDQSFVADLAMGGAGTAIVDTIIAMAHALGLGVLAEGIEDRAQQDYLRARGCDEGQGYLYSPAVPVHDFVETATRVERARRA